MRLMLPIISVELGPKESTISPKRKTNEGSPKPDMMDEAYPKIIRHLSFLSAYVRRIFEYGTCSFSSSFDFRYSSTF
jgi:hypothetical protein